MLPQCYFNCYEPFSRAFTDSQSYPMMPETNMGGQMPSQTQQQQNFPSNFEQAPGSPTTLDTGYTQGYLRTQIGKRMRVTFLLGTNLIQDREGILEEVGISYIVIKEVDTNIRTMCDIYAIKFASIFP
jgi:hypothetical protein